MQEKCCEKCRTKNIINEYRGICNCDCHKVQEESVVEDWEAEFDEFYTLPENMIPGPQREKAIKSFIRNLQKETDDKWKKKIENLVERIERVKVKTTEYESEAKMSLQVPTGKILPNGGLEMVTTVEQGKKYKHQTILDEEEIAFNKGLDQATSIIKKVI